MDSVCALDVRACTLVTLPRTACEAEAGVVQDGEGTAAPVCVFSGKYASHSQELYPMPLSFVCSWQRPFFLSLISFLGERGIDLCNRAVSSTKANTNYFAFFSWLSLC